jgi:hypothetical protein
MGCWLSFPPSQVCGQVMYSFLRMGLPPRLEGAGVDRLVTL